jgi:hypothetical protein
MKKLCVVLLVLAAVATGAFAQDVFASFNEPGDINLYASVGFYWNLEASVAAEYVIGEFALGPLPFDWGVAVRGGFDIGAGYFGYAAAALATLHTGLAVFPVEFYASIGAAFYGPTVAFPVSFATYGGATWWFSKNVGLLVENGYLGWYFWGVGVEFKL